MLLRTARHLTSAYRMAYALVAFCVQRSREAGPGLPPLGRIFAGVFGSKDGKTAYDLYAICGLLQSLKEFEDGKTDRKLYGV